MPLRNISLVKINGVEESCCPVSCSDRDSLRVGLLIEVVERNSYVEMEVAEKLRGRGISREIRRADSRLKCFQSVSASLERDPFLRNDIRPEIICVKSGSVPRLRRLGDIDYRASRIVYATSLLVLLRGRVLRRSAR